MIPAAPARCAPKDTGPHLRLSELNGGRDDGVLRYRSPSGTRARGHKGRESRLPGPRWTTAPAGLLVAAGVLGALSARLLRSSIHDRLD